MGFDFTSPRLLEQAREIDYLIEEKVLVQMSPKLFPGESGGRGTLVVTCSDGDQHQHIMMTHWANAGCRDCHHPFTNNGLGLRIATGSPAARPFEHEMWLEDIFEGGQIKDLTTIIIYGHWPCGIGEKFNLSLDEQVSLYFQAKDELAEHFRKNGQNPEAVVGLQVDHQYAQRPYKGIYHVDRHRRNNLRMINARERAYLVS